MATHAVVQVVRDAPVSIEFEACGFEGVEARAFGVGHFVEGVLGEEVDDCEGLGEGFAVADFGGGCGVVVNWRC
jgi:hypothetical protein